LLHRGLYLPLEKKSIPCATCTKIPHGMSYG
jgi:hypothetical protein